MPLLLLALTDGPHIPISEPILLVGRSNECDVVIRSRKVSRRHCVLVSRGQKLLVRDLASSNGVRVNVQRIVEAELRPGDYLQIATFLYQLIHKTTVHPDDINKPRLPVAPLPHPTR